jgi:hypothetical protein
VGKTWLSWHDGYEGDTPLKHRLLTVQRRIIESLDRHAGPIRVVSLCAGDGRDLLGVLQDHPRRDDVSGRLVELDPELAARAAAWAPNGIEVVEGDAGSTDAYNGAVPADLLLVCGVFGNISAIDIERTVRALPSMASPMATIIWTRHRRPPDRTPEIRGWFEDAGFRELSFDAPKEYEWSVGVHQLVRAPDPFAAGVRLFTFVR